MGGKVLSDKKQIDIEEYGTQSLWKILQENNICVSHVCNGNGTCGKCKVKVVAGNLPITEADRRCLSVKELEQGIRLACRVKNIGASKEEDIVIEVIENAEDSIVIEGIEKKEHNMLAENSNNITDLNSYFVAIDIGTTTIAMALVHGQTGEVCETYTSLNHQRMYGADVLSRITIANNGKLEELKRVIEEDLQQGIAALLQVVNDKNMGTQVGIKGDIQKESVISRIVISGNTTMIHLLMGYSCETLGKAPFVSQYLGRIEYSLQGITTTILPGIAAFVGADVVAGLLACPGFETEEISLLIDLGTNGEMVLGNKDKLAATSAAAGPAFEGGNIVCGTASIPGSISKVKIQNQRAVVKTIQDKMPPVGICGTGLISAISQLRQNKLLDEQGELKLPYHKQGYPLWISEDGNRIAIYQQDIREFQMAKSAIRAGIEILMEEYGCTAKEISNVYLAGGFGVNLSEEEAICTGILPKEFEGKIKSIGNGALKGSLYYGLEKEKKMNVIETSSENQKARITIDKKIEEIKKRATYISLAENSRFYRKYMQYLNFPVL